MNNIIQQNINNNILIVDDNAEIHENIKKILGIIDIKNDNDIYDLEELLFEKDNSKKNLVKDIIYKIDDAFQGLESLELIKKSIENENPYALLIMDLRMPPGIDGIEAISKIWEVDPYIEIIICTAYSDYSWKDIISKFGFTDQLLFLKKPFNPIEIQQMVVSLLTKWNLNNKIRNLINNLEHEVHKRTKQLKITLKKIKTINLKLKNKNKLLTNITKRDSLTGLFNHTTLHERLDSIFKQSIIFNFSLCVIMIDIDYFKKVNDKFGHLVGDELLKEISKILTHELNKIELKITQKGKTNEVSSELMLKNIAGRYGGDEFMVILPYCEKNKAIKIADCIIEGIKNIKLDIEPKAIMTASLGISFLKKNKTCDDYKKIIHLADIALYQSKNEGRNKITLLEF